MKDFLKLLAPKFMVFLFCIAFMGGYTEFFGVENTTVGVTLLMGVLIFMESDFGFNLKQAVLSIPFMFMLMGISSKLALIDPFLGIFINFITIWVLLTISSHDTSFDNHITFLMGYVFCQGYDLDGELYLSRLLSLFLGSLLIAGVYYMIHKKKDYDLTIKQLFTAFDIYSLRTQWYLKLTVVLTATLFICDYFNFTQGVWMGLTVVSLMQPVDVEHTKRGKHRLPATIIGCVGFYLVFEYIVPPQYMIPVSMLMGFASMFANTYFIKNIFTAFNALIPAMLLFSPVDAIKIRLFANLAGVVIAVTFDALGNHYFAYMAKRKKALEEENAEPIAKEPITN